MARARVPFCVHAHTGTPRACMCGQKGRAAASRCVSPCRHIVARDVACAPCKDMVLLRWTLHVVFVDRGAWGGPDGSVDRAVGVPSAVRGGAVRLRCTVTEITVHGMYHATRRRTRYTSYTIRRDVHSVIPVRVRYAGRGPAPPARRPTATPRAGRRADRARKRLQCHGRGVCGLHTSGDARTRPRDATSDYGVQW